MIAKPPSADVSYQLGSIQNALDTITKTLSEDRMASAQYRTEIRREMKDTRDAIDAVRTDLTLAKNDISTMKPTVDSLEQRAMMSKGAANLAIALGKFAHVMSAAVGGIVAIFLERWLHAR